MTAPLYRTQGLRHAYPGRPELPFPDLTIPAGRIVGLIGPNGAGKTTLLRLLAFLIPPTAGRLEYRGQEVRDEAARFALRREATLLLQQPYLLKASVARNVARGLELRGPEASPGEHGRRVSEALEMVGLAPGAFARRQWRQLSGGEAQRVALAARLALRPSVLLLDEPTASLDRESTARVRDAALAARSAWGTTLVVASHQHDWLARVADDMIELEDAGAPPPHPIQGK